MTVPLIDLVELQDMLIPLAGIWIPEDNPKNVDPDGYISAEVTVAFETVRRARRLLTTLDHLIPPSLPLNPPAVPPPSGGA